MIFFKGLKSEEKSVFDYFQNNQNTCRKDTIKFFKDERRKITGYIIKTYHLDMDNAEDCFLQGCSVLWRNITEGVLTPQNMTSCLSTYLTRCCCNHATHILRKNIQEPLLDDVFVEKEPGENDDNDKEVQVSNDFTDIKDIRIRVLEKVITNLPEPCNTILWNVYYNYHEIERKCKNKETIMDVIAQMLGINKTVLKVKKNRCMQKVKNKVNSML